MQVAAENVEALASGFVATLALNAVGSSAGIIAGSALGLVLVSRVKAVRWTGRAYVEVVRNTPFLLQAMVLFAAFGVARLRVEPFILGALAIALYTAAYMGEIVRGGLASVPAGQAEAARALGLGRVQTMRLVVLPQTLPFVVPATTNLLATIVKESAVLAAVAVAELTYQGQVIIGRTFAAFEIWTVVAGLYLALVLSIIGTATTLERRLSWSKGRH